MSCLFTLSSEVQLFLDFLFCFNFKTPIRFVFYFEINCLKYAMTVQERDSKNILPEVSGSTFPIRTMLAHNANWQ